LYYLYHINMKTFALKTLSKIILIIGLFCIFVLPVYLTRDIPQVSGYLMSVSIMVALFMLFEEGSYESKVSKNIESINKGSKFGNFILKILVAGLFLSFFAFYVWMFWAMFMHIYYLFV
jgi:uncharacterized membrane protein